MVSPLGSLRRRWRMWKIDRALGRCTTADLMVIVPGLVTGRVRVRVGWFRAWFEEWVPEPADPVLDELGRDFDSRTR